MKVDSGLFLIDATAFCYRAFYAIRSLSTSSGQPTNAVYGFVRMLQKILKEHNPEFLAVCFDVSRKTFRHQKDPEYKKNRPAMPDDLSGQISVIKEIIAAYNIPIFEKEGFEADDIIATISDKASKQRIPTTIISSDKDLLQLVDDNVRVLNPQKEEAKFDVGKVVEKFGIQPQQIADFIALAGDPTDNIPAIKGLSEKKAIDLIKQFHCVEALFDRVEDIAPAKVKNAVHENIERIRLNKELALLDKGVDLHFSLDKLKTGKPNYTELFRLFKTLEFKALLKDLPVVSDTKEIGLTAAGEKELKNLLSPGSELYLYGHDAKALAFWAAGTFFRVESAASSLKAVLEDPKIKKVSHDLKKIKLALNRQNIRLEGMFFDTMIAAYLLNPSESDYSLTDLAWSHLGKSLKADSLDNGQAVALILELKPKLEKQLSEKKLEKLFAQTEMPLVEVLAQMEIDGIKIDSGLLSKLSRELETRLSGLIAQIYDLCGCQFNINSPKQLRDVLFEKLKLPVVKKTKTGPSTDEEVLRKLALTHKLPAKLLEYRQLTKLKSTYVDALPQMADPSTSKIHASFNQTGTETGRLSSSNPNLQNMPTKTDLGRRIRESVIAFSKETCLLSCDYSQVELRILAHLSGDQTLTASFRENKDIHCKTASLIYGVEEKDLTEEMRNFAKRINFGIVYGLSAYGLSRDLDIGVEQAQGFIDAYFATYQKVKEYIARQISKAEEEGFVTTILGRRRYLPDIKNKNQAIRQFAQRQAVNTPIQGSASDLIKLAMVDIHKEIKEKRSGSKMIMQIHDELVFDVEKKELKNFSAMVKEKMETVLELSVPIRVDMKTGKNWSEMEEIK